MIVNEKDEFGDKVVFKWELLEREFKQLLADSDRNIGNVDKWWKNNKDNVLHYFQKGFEVLVEDYGNVMNDSIDEIWNTDREVK